MQTCVWRTSLPCWTGQRERILEVWSIPATSIDNVRQQGNNFECCWSQNIVRFVKNNSNKDMISPEMKYMPPEIYLWVDDHEEEKRENAVDDHVRVSQVNLDLGRSSILEFRFTYFETFFLFPMLKRCIKWTHLSKYLHIQRILP